MLITLATLRDHEFSSRENLLCLDFAIKNKNIPARFRLKQKREKSGTYNLAIKCMTIEMETSGLSGVNESVIRFDFV